MEIALLINEKAARAKIVAGIGGDNLVIKEYPTAADALREFTVRRFDLIVMGWKVYPGYGCNDAEIRELATLIPNSPDNENLLYWQVALKVICNTRDEDSRNNLTPVIFRFPELPESYTFGAGDVLTREAIATDLEGKGLIEAVYGVTMESFVGLLRKKVEQFSRRNNA
jgi:hypothetical protein